MRNWEFANEYFQLWREACGVHHSALAMRAQMQYVCYLAQEWAGVKK